MNNILLCIETSVGPFSIAIFNDDKLIDSYYHSIPHQQAEMLIPEINELLDKNKISYDAIKTIAVSIGPGSFTGIRIGLSAAQGISLGSNCKAIQTPTLNQANGITRHHERSNVIQKILGLLRRKLLAMTIQNDQKSSFTSSKMGSGIIGISTLDAIAQGFNSEKYLVALSAGRSQFYCKWFKNINGIISSDSEPMLLDAKYVNEEKADKIVISETHKSYPHLSAVKVGLCALNHTSSIHNVLSPIYIRPADAKLPSKTNTIKTDIYS